jgi:putative ABC transport system substrate-binding protein
VTGVSGATAELATKNLELIVEMLPAARRVAVLVNADSLFGEVLLEHVQAAAEVRKIEIKSIPIRESDQLDADFVSLEEWKPDALLIHPALPQKLIAVFAMNRRLPAVSPSSGFCEAGGLASYSADTEAASSQCARRLAKLLCRAPPPLGAACLA